jgi:hypothetical protein
VFLVASILGHSDQFLNLYRLLLHLLIVVALVPGHGAIAVHGAPVLTHVAAIDLLHDQGFVENLIRFYVRLLGLGRHKSLLLNVGHLLTFSLALDKLHF